MRLLVGMLVAVAAAGETYEARHEHLRGYCMGKLTVDERARNMQSVIRSVDELRGIAWRQT